MQGMGGMGQNLGVGGMGGGMVGGMGGMRGQLNPLAGDLQSQNLLNGGMVRV